jgi:uridine kinase
MRPVPPSPIRPGQPRPTVQARLPDGRIFEAPPGTTIGEILAVAGVGRSPAVAAVVNGRLAELTRPLTTDHDVTPVVLSDNDGAKIYRRSLVLLLVTAAAELFPDARITVDHGAANTGALFCRVHGRAPFSPADLNDLTWHMSEIVAADDPILKVPSSVGDAVPLFERRGDDDTARLLAHRDNTPLVLCELRGRRDYFQGYMVPSAGLLQWFALHPFGDGFMLQYPRQHRPNVLDPIAPYPKLFAVFQEHGGWLDRLGIRGAGALNDAIVAGRIAEVSLVGEALHEARIARIAADIAAERHRVRVVLIAGPSSSGKTTFSKRLAVQLLANGVRPFPIGLDDYFLDRDRTPRDEKGDFDFESLHALDVPLFNDQLLALSRGETVQLPRYNFKTGLREAGHVVRLESDHVIIVEGIHGLNPDLVPGLPPEQVYRVYVSALTQLNLDNHNRVSTTDCRLVRRVVRDAATRGYDATATLKRWESVNAGEKKHIFPFQENSDAIFNSALAHELAVLRPLAEPLLLQVRPDTPQWIEANRLLSFLQWFRPVPPDVVPTNSILREFVGGSVLETFRFEPM